MYLSINCLPSFVLRVGPGWQTCCFSWHSFPVLIIRLRELKCCIRPTWIIHLHGACFPSNAVTCNSTSSRPYTSTSAPPSSSNCTAVKQCQCRHGKNQWRYEDFFSCFFGSWAFFWSWAFPFFLPFLELYFDWALIYFFCCLWTCMVQLFQRNQILTGLILAILQQCQHKMSLRNFCWVLKSNIRAELALYSHK